MNRLTIIAAALLALAITPALADQCPPDWDAACAAQCAIDCNPNLWDPDPYAVCYYTVNIATNGEPIWAGGWRVTCECGCYNGSTPTSVVCALGPDEPLSYSLDEIDTLDKLWQAIEGLPS